MATLNGTAPPAAAAPRRDALSGTVIAGSALVMAALMTQHPHMGHHDTTADLFAEGARIAAATEFVHAAMLIAMAALVFGFLGLAARIGPERPSVRLGAVAWVGGAIAGGGAAVLNGLAFPEMARHFAEGTPAELEMAETVLTFSHFVSQSLAGVGVLSWSVAIFAWSIAIVGCGRAWKWIAIFGFFISMGPAAMYLGGHLALDVHGFGVFIFSQALWSIAAGIALALGRSAP